MFVIVIMYTLLERIVLLDLFTESDYKRSDEWVVKARCLVLIHKL